MAGKWGRRRRFVYGYNALDLRGAATTVKLGYVGKTSSPLYYRDAQHKEGKLWAWAIVGEIFPIWEGDCGRVALWFREVYYIRKLRPMFNVDWNKSNPVRVPPWEARKLYGRSKVRYHQPRRSTR